VQHFLELKRRVADGLGPFVPNDRSRLRSLRLLGVPSIQAKIARSIVLRPFGNSQKGIRNGWLTWVEASDKFWAIR
jgi:hypothetical protein